MTSNRLAVVSGLGMGLLTCILQSSISAFVVCVSAAVLFVIALWRRKEPAPLATGLYAPTPTWNEDRTEHPYPPPKRTWLIPNTRWRASMLGGATSLFALSVVMGLIAISENRSYGQTWAQQLFTIKEDTTAIRERQTEQVTKEEIEAWKEEMLAAMRAEIPVDDPVDPSIERDLVAAVDRLARAAGTGELTADRALADLEPTDVVDYLHAQRRKLELGQKSLNMRIEEEKIALERELAAVAYTIGRIDEAEQALERILKVLPCDIDAIIRLAIIHQLRGRLDEAEGNYHLVLTLAEDDETAQAAAYGNLGGVMRVRGDLDGAEAMYRKSLAIDERLGRLDGMASDYGNLGNIMQIRGDLERAEALHRTSFALEVMLGRVEGMASQYGNLGNIMLLRGDLEGAEAMYRKSLEIEEKLGRLEGMANAYGGLGNVMQIRSDLEGAEAMYRKSLAIDERLGRLEGMANAYGNLGILIETRGDLGGALEMWTKSRDLYTKLRAQPMVDQVQGWIDELPE